MTAPRIYKLRDDLVIRRRVFADEVKYVVKDPLRLDYFTIDEVSYTLLSFCDGKRGLAELSELAGKLFPHAGFDALTLLNFYETYRKSHFFADPWETNVLLIEKQRANRGRALKKALANPLEISLPAWDPDRFFNRIVEPLGFLFTIKALFVYGILIVAAIAISTSRAQEFALSFGELWVIQGRALVGIITLWLILFFTVVLHEVGHGLTCKHFGGEVHKIGFLFLYFNPCLYCDVTEAYFFEDKRKKHAVTLAGGVVDLLTASIATFVWYLTSPDLFLNEVAHRVAIFNGVSGILINFNPLMKYDGYFVLSDHLEIPNLRGDSFRFIGNRIKALLGVPHEDELVSSRERRVFWIYGILGIAYSIFVLLFVALFVGSWLVSKFDATGYLITACLVLVMTQKYLRGLGVFVRFFALSRGGHFRRYRWIYLGTLVLFLAFFFLVPLPRHVQGDFTLSPGREVVLRAREPSVIEEVRFAEGDVVPRGAAPIILRADEVEQDRQYAMALAATARAERAAAQVMRDRGRAAAEGARLEGGLALERYQTSREGRLTPQAPWEGVMLSPYLRERVGDACLPGDTLCVLGELTTLLAEVLLDERDIGLVRMSTQVELRTMARPGRLVTGQVHCVSQEPVGGQLRRLYRVLVKVDNHEGELRPGLTGRARFDAGKVPAFQHLVASVARVFRIEFWI